MQLMYMNIHANEPVHPSHVITSDNAAGCLPKAS